MRPKRYGSIVTKGATLAPEAIDVDGACRLLGIGRSKLYRMIRAGELPSVKLGDRRLLRLETVRALLAGLERVNTIEAAGDARVDTTAAGAAA
jgi:excisionase family DNA binding protein